MEEGDDLLLHNFGCSLVRHPPAECLAQLALLSFPPGSARRLPEGETGRPPRSHPTLSQAARVPPIALNGPHVSPFGPGSPSACPFPSCAGQA